MFDKKHHQNQYLYNRGEEPEPDPWYEKFREVCWDSVEKAGIQTQCHVIESKVSDLIDQLVENSRPEDYDGEVPKPETLDIWTDIVKALKVENVTEWVKQFQKTIKDLQAKIAELQMQIGTLEFDLAHLKRHCKTEGE